MGFCDCGPVRFRVLCAGILLSVFGFGVAGAASTTRYNDFASKSSRSVSVSGFVVLMAHIAGAEQFCDPPKAAAVRVCSEKIVANWHALTGQPIPGHAVLLALPVIWKSAFMIAFHEQSGRDRKVSCAVVGQQYRSVAIWSSCGP